MKVSKTDSIKGETVDALIALGKTKVSVEGAASLMRIAIEQTRKQERERAAKLVDSFNHVPSSHDNWYVDDEVICGFMNAMRILAAKIRGEENE